MNYHLRVRESISEKKSKRKEDTFGMNDEDWNVYRTIVSDTSGRDFPTVTYIVELACKGGEGETRLESEHVRSLIQLHSDKTIVVAPSPRANVLESRTARGRMQSYLRSVNCWRNTT